MPEAPLPEEQVDPSHAMDLVSVFKEMGADAEMEAIAIHGMLESMGIPSVLVGSSVLPNLSFEVRVPQVQAQEALRLITDAEENSMKEGGASDDLSSPQE